MCTAAAATPFLQVSSEGHRFYKTDEESCLRRSQGAPSYVPEGSAEIHNQGLELGPWAWLLHAGCWLLLQGSQGGGQCWLRWPRTRWAESVTENMDLWLRFLSLVQRRVCLFSNRVRSPQKGF